MTYYAVEDPNNSQTNVNTINETATFESKET